MVVDGASAEPAFDAGSGHIWGADGGRLADVVSSGNKKSLLVVYGQIGSERDEIGGPPQFSPDGEHIAYMSEQVGATRPFLDSGAGATFDSVRGPAFSPDERVIFFGAQGKTLLRVNMSS